MSANAIFEVTEAEDIAYITSTYFLSPIEPHATIFGLRIKCACFDIGAVGYVAVETVGSVGVLHLGMKPHCKTAAILGEVSKMFKSHVVPELRERGLETLTANCALNDRGTTRMLRSIGMQIQEVVVGTYKI